MRHHDEANPGRIVLLVSALTPLSSSLLANAPAQEPACFTSAVAVDLAQYLPEGDSEGDELKPSSISRDLVINCSWSGGGEPRNIAVFLFSSDLKGQCINSGELTLPDFTIEASRNSEWVITGPDVPAYHGTQSSNTPTFGCCPITAETINPVPAGTIVPLRVTSYDWGGSGFVRVEALPFEECEPAPPVAFPQDTDGDKLPNGWEGNQEFWFFNSTTNKNEKKKYDTGAAQTSGVTAANDGQSDQDLDAMATPLFTVFSATASPPLTNTAA